MAATEATAQSMNSLASMELLAEEQAAAINHLELQLKKIEEENEQLIEKQKLLDEEISKKQAAAIQQFITSEVRLAHAMSVLPVKRPRRSSEKESEDEAREQLCQTGILNPAVNFVYQKGYEAAQAGKSRLQQSYDDLIAWKFTPDSASGMRLMSCMRQLLEKNKHLGSINQMDRLLSLESETQMQASCIQEYMKTAQELDAVLQESSTDLDGVQSSLFTLKKQLNKAEALINALKAEYDKQNPGQSDALIAAALATLSEQAIAAEDQTKLEDEDHAPAEPQDDAQRT
ncbi:unnamed protein product [Mesocestoides corti]|uniref:Uncharacterized protein n=2 Tax=Mesocestoides corti TaxID=53468 RepID=A0A0R3UJL8_MESCO|nr:unnamed protein product [Mesocestoides corti]